MVDILGSLNGRGAHMDRAWAVAHGACRGACGLAHRPACLHRETGSWVRALRNTGMSRGDLS